MFRTMKVMLFAMALGQAVATSATLRTDLALNLEERPVMKVVRLLQDTKAELEKELDDDKAVYELMTCWCNSNDQEKAAAIDAGKAKIAELESSMGADAAKIAELKAKRKETLDEVNADHKALSDATGMRMKENKEFQASETDYLEAIDAAKNAIVVLGKHNPSLTQLRSVAHTLLDARVSQLVDNSRAVNKANVGVLRTFLRNAETSMSFLAIPGMQSYAPQSGQIFGILGQMKEDFEANLSEAQKSEAKAKAEYESLKAAKEDEIDTGRKLIVSTDANIAETQENFAQEAKQLEDTQAQLAMDIEFLRSLKEKCATMDADYDKRVKDRLTEIDAVGDTIKILNSDESFEAFDKQEAPVFLQTASEEKETRQQAVSVLRRAATASGSPQIALLAASAQLDAFTKVKALIDKMVAELTNQQSDEVDKRDWCISELNSNKRDTTAAYDKKASLETQKADLTKNIEKLTKDIDSSKAAVAEMMNQMKRASETREAENADFQTTVNDHRVMSMILTKALDRMKQVYALLQQRSLKPGAPHTQTSATHTDPGNGPAKFADNSAKNGGGGRVVAMLEEVLADTRKTEDQAIASEQDSQSSYENFMKDSNKAITKTTQSISDMTGARATAKEELSMAKTDFSQTMTELQGLDQTNADLHKSCDFVLQNFDARQAARSAEMDALREAKNILSGAK
jgi:chromosome segregation ATPase